VPGKGSQAQNRYMYVKGNPLRYIDPSGHCIPGVDCPGDIGETGGIVRESFSPVGRESFSFSPVGSFRPGSSLSPSSSPAPTSPPGAPPWDSLAPLNMPWGGSRESLYFHAFNHGLAPWQDNPGGSIDDRFNPFYMVAFSGDEISGEYLRFYKQEVAQALYQPYGGIPNLPGLVAAQCATDFCNNPLNYEDYRFARLSNDEEIAAQSTIVTAYDNRALSLFLRTLPGVDYDIGWNYEPIWMSELMVQHPEEFLQAQWTYLDMYRQASDSIDPELVPDFTEK
jgi:hypothetical protein